MTGTSHVLYEHRQTGWAIVVSSAFPVLLLFVVRAVVPTVDRTLPHLLPLAFVALALVGLLGFGSLAIVLTRDRVVARFGVGLFRRTIPLERIRRVTVVRTCWAEGWGIHRTRRGMLYNVSGFDAVALELVDGRTVRFGSDDATRLRFAIERALAERARTG